MGKLSKNEENELNSAFNRVKSSGVNPPENGENAHVNFVDNLKEFNGIEGHGEKREKLSMEEMDAAEAARAVEAEKRKMEKKRAEAERESDRKKHESKYAETASEKSERQDGFRKNLSGASEQSHRRPEHHHSHHGSEHTHGSHNRREHSDSEKAKHNKQKIKRFKTWQKAVLAVLIVILILVLSAAVTVYILHSNGKKEVLEDNHFGESFENVITYNGVDYKYNENMTSVAFLGVDRTKFGVEDDRVGSSGQADVNMVVALNTDTGKTTVIVIPRDSETDIDKYSLDGKYIGTDKSQLCLAYAYGDGKEASCQNSITSIQRILYGIPINTYFALNLEGVAELNDCIGGVTVTCNENLMDKFYEGQEVTLFGTDAENFIRFRNTELDSDVKRRERQVTYVKSYVQKAGRSALEDSDVLGKIYDVGSEYSVTNLNLARSMYFGSLVLGNREQVLSFDNIITLTGKLTEDKEGSNTYAKTELDDEDVLKKVLEIYYTPVN